MTNLKDFIHLDFMTIKPYFTVKTMLLFGVVSLFLTMTSGSIFSGIGVGMILGTIFLGYPFSLGEKNNLDVLYATLSVKRKTVVQGRYAFTLLLNCGTILFSFVIALAGLLVANATGFTSITTGWEYAGIWLIFSAALIFIQAIQLPIYFKFGYAKARFFSIIPLAAVIAGYFAFLNISGVNAELAGILDKLPAVNLLIPVIAVTLMVFVFASYGLSAMYYKKREF